MRTCTALLSRVALGTAGLLCATVASAMDPPHCDKTYDRIGDTTTWRIRSAQEFGALHVVLVVPGPGAGAKDPTLGLLLTRTGEQWEYVLNGTSP